MGLQASGPHVPGPAGPSATAGGWSRRVTTGSACPGAAPRRRRATARLCPTRIRTAGRITFTPPTFLIIAGKMPLTSLSSAPRPPARFRERCCHRAAACALFCAAQRTVLIDALPDGTVPESGLCRDRGFRLSRGPRELRGVARASAARRRQRDVLRTRQPTLPRPKYLLTSTSIPRATPPRCASGSTARSPQRARRWRG